METILRPMEGNEKRLFAVCVLVSAALHALLAWTVLPGGGAGGKNQVTRLAERFAQSVNRVTELDTHEKARLEEVLSRVEGKGWRRVEMGETLQWVGTDLGLPIGNADVVRALDPERSQEGRWDVRVWLSWGEGRGAGDLLKLAYAAGEGTLKSDFGSHRVWVHLQAEDGAGRVMLETMDCRLYRAGKLSAADLLHRSSWVEP